MLHSKGHATNRVHAVWLRRPRFRHDQQRHCHSHRIAACARRISSGSGTTQTFPSVLYFERRKEGTLTRLTSAAGPKALQRYLDAEDKGRLIQSLKAYLGDRRFDGTGVFSQHYSLEDMIALIARHLLEDARGLTAATSPEPDRIPSRAVVGRPVHFSNALDQEDDEFALARLRGAIAQCGFTDIVFEYEPVAAAYSYEQTLHHDELILIGDFGGGTSDFSDSARRSGPAAARTRARHHRHRRCRRSRRRFRQTDHPQARRAAIGARLRVFLAAGQVPADPELAVRTARALASSVFSQYGQEPRDAGTPSAERADSGTAGGIRSPHQERNGISAARGRTAGRNSSCR